MKVLMVCLGNICRSPLAQGILESKMPNWEVDSAGTAAYHLGQAPDPRSIRIAGENGIDISGQRARQLVAKDLMVYDLILTMDTENYTNTRRLADTEGEKAKVHLICNFIKAGRNAVVPDPYYNDRFQEVYDLLDAATDRIIEKYS